MDYTLETKQAPRRTTAEAAEYDQLITALKSAGGKALGVTVPPEGNVKSIRTKLSHAATRAGVKLTQWYDPDDAKVWALLKTPLPA